MGSGKGGGGGRRRIAGGGGGSAQGTKPPEQLEPLQAHELDTGTATGLSSPTDPVLNPGGSLTGPGVAAENLPTTAQDSIIAYSGAYVQGGERFRGLNAEKLNRSLYDPEGFKRTLELAGETPEAIADYVKRAKAYKVELDESLSRVRNYSGEVYRVVDNVNVGGRQLADTFEAGKVAHFKEFLSTSRAPNPSYKAYANASIDEVRFKIKSKRGKSIETISGHGPEREVLFKSGSSFRVTRKVWNQGRGTWDIDMEEI